MDRFLIVISALTLLTGCTGRVKAKIVVTAAHDKADSLKADSMDRVAATLKPANAELKDDSTSEDPTFGEVKAELVSRYNKIERIDTTVKAGGDTFYIHEKYYCLKDNSVVVPKKYLWGGDKTKDFVTHSFVSAIFVVKNRDTIINKIFRKSDFYPVINTEERKYAVIFSASFLGYRKHYDGIVFGYSITIPLTDVGVPAYIVIGNKGKYKMLDEYAKVDEDQN